MYSPKYFYTLILVPWERFLLYRRLLKFNLSWQKLGEALPKWGLSSVWPDLVKFRHFGKIFKKKIWGGYLLCGKILELIWQILYAIGQLFALTSLYCLSTYRRYNNCQAQMYLYFNNFNFKLNGTFAEAISRATLTQFVQLKMTWDARPRQAISKYFWTSKMASTYELRFPLHFVLFKKGHFWISER